MYWSCGIGEGDIEVAGAADVVVVTIGRASAGVGICIVSGVLDRGVRIGIIDAREIVGSVTEDMVSFGA